MKREYRKLNGESGKFKYSRRKSNHPFIDKKQRIYKIRVTLYIFLFSIILIKYFFFYYYKYSLLSKKYKIPVIIFLRNISVFSNPDSIFMWKIGIKYFWRIWKMAPRVNIRSKIWEWGQSSLSSMQIFF